MQLAPGAIERPRKLLTNRVQVPVKWRSSNTKKSATRARGGGERESFIRNNLHNGVVSGAARGQALRGPMWAGLTPDSKGDPTGDTEEPDRRRQETPHLSARRKEALPASPGGPPCTGQKKLRVLNPILRLYRIQSTGKRFRMRVEVC